MPQREQTFRMLLPLVLVGLWTLALVGCVDAPRKTSAPGNGADNTRIDAPSASGGPLSNLYRERTGTTRRISSHDKTGANGDRVSIEPGETKTIADIQGAGIIRHIWCTISHRDPLYRRNLVLRIYWDGSETPSVESPIGDFFGQGWSEHYLMNSLPIVAGPKDGRGLNCYFPMPFAREAKITVENQSDIQCRAFYFYVDYEEHASMDDPLRFHAWWNRELTTPANDVESERDANGDVKRTLSDSDNYLIVDAEGRGHYVGINYFVDSPTPRWYGEGDDMFTIDGEAWPPRLHGTGTEDYFNSSWCPNEVFQHPYFGYPRVNDKIGWLGRTHCYRFHIEDPILFEKSLRASIEHGHANSLTLDICTVAYWYQTLPHKPFPALPTRDERKPLRAINHDDIQRWREAWRESKGGGTLWGTER